MSDARLVDSTCGAEARGLDPEPEVRSVSLVITCHLAPARRFDRLNSFSERGRVGLRPEIQCR